MVGAPGGWSSGGGGGRWGALLTWGLHAHCGPGLAASAPPGRVWEMQNLGPQLDLPS